MGFFEQSGTIELAADPASMPAMVASLERLIEYTGGEVTRDSPHNIRFSIPPFIWAGRTKPLARLSRGDVELRGSGPGNVEARYTVRTSRTNVVAGIIIIAMLVVTAILAWQEGQTSNPFVVALVIGLGPLFAFTLVHQSVTRSVREIKDACLLGASYGQ
jgi:hypothetical protein